MQATILRPVFLQKLRVVIHRLGIRQEALQQHFLDPFASIDPNQQQFFTEELENFIVRIVGIHHFAYGPAGIAYEMLVIVNVA